MQKKLYYTTPETELIEVMTEASLLTVSGGETEAGASPMTPQPWVSWGD